MSANGVAVGHQQQQQPSTANGHHAGGSQSSAAAGGSSMQAMLAGMTRERLQQLVNVSFARHLLSVWPASMNECTDHECADWLMHAIIFTANERTEGSGRERDDQSRVCKPSEGLSRISAIPSISAAEPGNANEGRSLSCTERGCIHIEQCSRSCSGEVERSSTAGAHSRCKAAGQWYCSSE